ncbi:Xylose isomerase-like TIM barrel [Rubripirellula tenax]|uniref:Xylose isomerase-like TIM barrel n=1 Tax=Rubripirellula tenax TaxID=2528015 RepID=A0A5C6F2D8_9BACT|nr:TIM barrel protein [Rubripirellula tenax]TWU54527.1 Xylose isomerase-like TIM barrel [Rubripirellula tenax]
MISGYHLSGLSLHDPATAIGELAHLGYAAVAIRPHAAYFHPDVAGFSQHLLRISDAIDRHSMRLVIDLDGLYLHDVYSPRGPSLIAADASVCGSARIWIERWVGIADEINAGMLTFSVGQGEASAFVSDEEDLERLSEHLKQVIAQTDGSRVSMGIRPTHGDVIGSVAQFERLQHWMGEQNERLGLAADVGEMLAAGEMPISDRLARNLSALRCVYLCDRQSGAPDDQRIGQGEVVLSRIVHSLRTGGYKGTAIVRVEGHSAEGLVPAQEALEVFD